MLNCEEILKKEFVHRNKQEIELLMKDMGMIDFFKRA